MRLRLTMWNIGWALNITALALFNMDTKTQIGCAVSTVICAIFEASENIAEKIKQ